MSVALHVQWNSNVESLYCGDLVKCPVRRGILISRVNLHIRDIAKCRGILIAGVSFERGSTIHVLEFTILVCCSVHQQHHLKFRLQQ